MNPDQLYYRILYTRSRTAVGDAAMDLMVSFLPGGKYKFSYFHRDLGIIRFDRFSEAINSFLECYSD